MTIMPDAPDPDANFETLLPVRLRKICDLFEDYARSTMIGADLEHFTEMRILSYVSAHPHAPTLEISRELAIDKGWISRLLRSLHERGLIDRRRATSDRRIMRIELTQAGRETHAEMLTDVMRHHAQIMQGLDRFAADALCDVLEANIRRVLTELQNTPSA